MKKYENFCASLVNMKTYGFGLCRRAYKAGMIKDEELWLRALQARNNVTHSYNQKIALGIVAEAKADYYDMFTKLKTEIESNWI